MKSSEMIIRRSSVQVNGYIFVVFGMCGNPTPAGSFTCEHKVVIPSMRVANPN